MLSEAFGWMKKAIVDRKATILDGVSRPNVTLVQVPQADGSIELVSLVDRKPFRAVVHDADSFVTAVKEQFRHRYGEHPYDGPQEPEKPPVMHNTMPVTVMVAADGVVARLFPTDTCRVEASRLEQGGVATFDEIRMPLTPSIAWQRLVSYAGNSRLKQADIVREWEDVWQDCTYHRLADKFRKIEIATRTEVTTGPRRDAGVSEFETKASDELPEKIDLGVERWLEYTFGQSTRPKVDARIVLERSTPPTVGIVPVVGQLDKATIDAVEKLKRDLEYELRELKIPVLAGSFKANNE